MSGPNEQAALHQVTLADGRTFEVRACDNAQAYAIVADECRKRFEDVARYRTARIAYHGVEETWAREPNGAGTNYRRLRL